jgi:hypothetical protein
MTGKRGREMLRNSSYHAPGNGGQWRATVSRLNTYAGLWQWLSPTLVRNR